MNYIFLLRRYLYLRPISSLGVLAFTKTLRFLFYLALSNMASTSVQSAAFRNVDFRLKEGSDLLSPKDMLELARVGTGTANNKGDLVHVPVSKHSFEETK